MPLHHRDNEESQVRGERQTLIWCLIMDVKEVDSPGSSCIPSIEILLEVSVLPSNIQKNLSFWTGTSLIILLQICNMKQMNCSAFWIALQFIFISLWNTSLNRQHTFLSNLRSFSVPYILVVLIFFGEKIYSTCLSLQISTWLIKQIIKWFHKNFISVWRKPYSSLKKTLNIQE